MKTDFKINMSVLGDALKRTKQNTSDSLGKACLSGLFTLEGHAKINVKSNFKQRTGFLGSAWETKLEHVTDTKASGYTSPLAVYARIQELGGVIHATNAPALHFQTDDGQWHTVKAVTIPARPYLRPAADEFQNDIFNSVASVLHDAIEGK